MMPNLTEREQAQIAAFVAAISAAFGYSTKRLRVQIRETESSNPRGN